MQLGMEGSFIYYPDPHHLDHGGGSGALAALFPQAKMVVHPRGLKHMLDPSRLIEGTKQAYGDDFELQYGPIARSPITVSGPGGWRNIIHQGGENCRLSTRPVTLITK